MKSQSHFFRAALVCVAFVLAVLAIPLVHVSGGGCTSPDVRGPDADADSDSDTDSDTDTDGDADTDTETETSTDTESETDTGGGTWYDSSTHLTWEDPPNDTQWDWLGAASVCEGRTLGGYDDWRLPSISELRSLVLGNVDTMTDGACGVTDECASYADCHADTCNGEPYLEGPGEGGCYWDVQISGWCWGYWSSTALSDSASSAWYLLFYDGSPNADGQDEGHSVRCVRG